MEKPDIVVVGELNVDLILTGLSSLPGLGQCRLSRDMHFTLGSASAIFASNIARLGMKVGFVGKVGADDLGNFILKSLNTRNIDTSRIIQDNRSKTGICVSMSYPEDYAMASFAGVRESFTPADVDMDYVLKAKHLHMSSYYLQPGMQAGCAEMFRKAKKAGLSTSFDPDSDPSGKWDDSIFEVLEHVDIFLPNEKEALHISRSDKISAALNFLAKKTGTVVIKTGKSGAWAKNRDTTVHAGAFKVDTIDTTGAGDSFNSGFIYRFLRGSALDECMLWGNACAALSTTRLGGTDGFPDIREVEHFLNENRTE
ncbi:MAG: carbohydrate kinase family protein, partial [Calditrichia bacterium]